MAIDVTLTPVQDGFDGTAINANNNTLETVLLRAVSRFGDSPNAMQADFDMNGFRILNLANPVELSSFNWLGNWQTVYTYKIGDTVFYNSTSYLCGIAHTSGVFITDLLAAKWLKVDLGTKFKGAWAATTPYYIGDIIISSNQFYYCTTDHISGGSFVGTNWLAYGTFGSMAAQNANAVAITGGTAILSSATITALIAAAIANTALTGGTINNTVIGSITPLAGTFTNAFDDGNNPTTSAQLTNKQYVDGSITNTTVGGLPQYCIQVPGPGGVSMKMQGGLLNITGGTTGTVSFPVSFATGNKSITATAAGTSFTVSTGSFDGITFILHGSSDGIVSWSAQGQ